MAVLLKPFRGKSTDPKTNHKPAANDSARPERKSLAVSRILSTSTSSVGSEVVEEGPPGSPRKAVQEVHDKRETGHGGVEGKHSSEDAHEGSGKAAVERPRNPIRVSTMSMSKCV